MDEKKGYPIDMTFPTAVLRKGKRLDEHTFTWRFFENIWRYVIPFRPLIIKIYSLFKSLNCLRIIKCSAII